MSKQIKKPVAVKPIWGIRDDYKSPIDENLTHGCGSGKSMLISAFLLNDWSKSHEVKGYKKVYRSKSKVGRRLVKTIKMINKAVKS